MPARPWRTPASCATERTFIQEKLAMIPTHQPSEPFYAHWAWLFLLTVAVLGGVFGALSFLPSFPPPNPIEGSACCAGNSLNNPHWLMPYAVERERLNGAVLLGFSLLGMAVILTSYRRGERWAWFALWSFPLVFVLQSPFVGKLDMLALVFCLLGLILPYRTF